MELVVIVWLGLFVAFLIVEAACPIHLVSLWFAAGALAALAVWALGGALWLQITVFLAVSCLLLAMLWPLTKKYLNPMWIPSSVPPVWSPSLWTTSPPPVR